MKTGDKPLKPGQEDFWAAWRGNKKIVLCDVEDAVELARRWPQVPADADLGGIVAYHRHRRGKAGTA